MFNKVYITVETTFYGDTLGFISNPPASWDQLNDIIGDAIVIATDAYHELAENADVPYDVLWESVSATGVSTFRPSESYIKWINLD